MRAPKRITLTLALLLLAAAARARGGAAEPEDPLERHLFPPELVMENGSRIGLDETQRKAIRAAIQETLPSTLDLEWQAQDQTRELERLLAEPRPDLEAVLAQADRVLELERKVKRAHLSLLVRIKRTLTPEQQQKLQRLRRGG